MDAAVKKVTKFRRYLPQIIAVSIKNVLLLVYGLTLGMPTILIPHLDGTNEEISFDKDGISWLGSINFLSVPLGCLLSGIVTKPIGRIKSMQILSVSFFSAFLLYYFATKSWQILFALFLTGFTGGLLEAPTLIYTVEVCEPSLRGALSATSTFAIIIGMMLTFLLGGLLPWRTMAIINSTIPILCFVLLWFIPESPYYLLQKQQFEESKKCLAWLRGWTDVLCIEKEFDELRKSVENQPKFSLKRFGKSTFIKPYLIVCFSFVLAYFGTPQVTIYAVKIFELLKVPINPYYATILIGVTEFIGSLLLVFLVKLFGKRYLCFVAQLGVGISFLVAGIHIFNVGANNFETQIATTTKSWLPVISILSIGFFSYLMTYTLPWIVMGEFYPENIRDIASGLSAGSGYIIGFVANKTFLNLVDGLSLAGTFWFYALIAFVGIVFMYFLLPETEGKSLVDITEHFAGRSKLTNKIGNLNTNNNLQGEFNQAYEVTDLDGVYRNIVN